MGEEEAQQCSTTASSTPTSQHKGTTKISPANGQKIDEVLKKDLNLTPFKRQRRHKLSAANKEMRRIRCSALLELLQHNQSPILFSDEKLFVLQQSHNGQNDRVWAVSKEDIPAALLYVERTQGAKGIMVFGAVSEKGRMPLLFIDVGVKINKDVYLRDVLQNHVLRNAHRLFGVLPWIFQQDSAPAHGARVVQQWCRINLPHFISKEQWPACSPDANPLDYCIWGVMLEALSEIDDSMSLSAFRQKLRKVWRDIPEEIIVNACKSFPDRLRKIVAADGGRIE